MDRTGELYEEVKALNKLLAEVCSLTDPQKYLFLDSNERLEEIRKLVKDNQ